MIINDLTDTPITVKHAGRPPKIRRPRGRPKVLKTQIDEALKLLDAELPGLINKLIQLAYDKSDRDALIYLIDRKMGRPRQEIDSRIKAQIIMSPDDYELATRNIIEAEVKLIEQYIIPQITASPTSENQMDNTTITDSSLS